MAALMVKCSLISQLLKRMHAVSVIGRRSQEYQVIEMMPLMSIEESGWQIQHLDVNALEPMNVDLVANDLQ